MSDHSSQLRPENRARNARQPPGRLAGERGWGVLWTCPSKGPFVPLQGRRQGPLAAIFFLGAASFTSGAAGHWPKAQGGPALPPPPPISFFPNKTGRLGGYKLRS